MTLYSDSGELFRDKPGTAAVLFPGLKWERCLERMLWNVLLHVRPLNTRDARGDSRETRDQAARVNAQVYDPCAIVRLRTGKVPFRVIKEGDQETRRLVVPSTDVLGIGAQRRVAKRHLDVMWCKERRSKAC